MKRLGALAIALGALAFARAARAHDTLGFEAGGGVSKPGAQIPASAFEYQRVQGRYELSDAATIGAQIKLTRDFLGPRDATSALRTGTDWVWLGALDVTYELAKRWSLGVTLTASPPSERDVAAPLVFTTGDAAGAGGNALVRATNANVGGSVDVGYDTFDLDGDPHAVDGAIDASLGYTYYATTQVLASLEPDPLVPSPCLSGGCGPAPRGTASLSQLRAELAATLTVAERTDFGLDAAYYLYSPGGASDLGFFEETLRDANGRDLGRARFGAGLPLLPPRASLRAELAHRFEAASVRAFYQLTDYAIDGWTGHTVGGKLQFKIGKHLRPYLTGSYRLDVEPDATAGTWTAALGAIYAF